MSKLDRVIEALQDLKEELEPEEEEEQGSSLGLYRVQAPMEEYNSIMARMRSLVWPGGKNE